MDFYASSSGEEEELGAVNFALSREASLLFQAKKYSDCLDILNQLLPKKPRDPKVLHNIAITKYFCGGCSDLKKLLDELNDAERESEDQARASSESAGGNKDISDSKENRRVEHQTSAASNARIEEFGTSITSLNIAVIWYHLHEYSKALSVLEPIYQSIESIDETTARHSCLLLLDIALASQDAFRSADVLNYLEKAFGSSSKQGDNGNLEERESLNPVSRSTSILRGGDACISDSAASINSSDSCLSRELSEETNDYENLLLTLDIGGENLGRSLERLSSRTSADRNIPSTDRLNLQLYKVRFLLLTRSLKTMKRDVKEAVNLAQDGDSTIALLLKAQFEYARGNYYKSLKLLMSSTNQSETAISSVHNNNFGCIYYCLGKYHTSSIFFSRALHNNLYLHKQKKRDLLAFSQDQSPVLMYNCGLQYLASGKPFLAARCFLKATCLYYSRPLFWFRIAECCLMALENGLLKSDKTFTEGSEVRVQVIGKGNWRQLAMEGGASRGRYRVFLNKKDETSGNIKHPKLSLPFARQCLLYAFYLLNSSSNSSGGSFPSNHNIGENDLREAALLRDMNHTDTVSDKVISNGNVTEQKIGQIQTNQWKTCLAEYEQICKKENHMIKQALLANLAYVELELGNPLKALSMASYLLKLHGCSRIYIFLGHVYAAEALCLLDRPNEGAEHLSVYLSGENYFGCPYVENDWEQLSFRKLVDQEEANGNGTSGPAKNPSVRNLRSFVCPSPEEARGMLYVNFATACAIQGNLEQAQIYATQALSIVPNCSEAILSVVYVNLMLGKVQEAITMLKQCNRVHFLPGNLTSNQSFL